MECMVDGCVNVARGKGLCSLHYQRLKRLGSADAELKVVGKYQGQLCSVYGCGRYAKKLGWCELHYNRWRRLGTTDTGKAERLPNFSQQQCKVDGCGKPAMALNCCSNHYRKLKKYGDPLGGTIHDGRSKDWHVRKGGYVIKFDRENIHANKISGIVFQHRQVMGELIGRPLKSNENVHHKNGDRTDNRLDNLELWVKSQPAGQRVQDKIKWAREILHEYGEIADKL